MSAATFEDFAVSPCPGRIALIIFLITRAACDFESDGAGNACSQGTGVFHSWQRTHNATMEVTQDSISLCFAQNTGTITMYEFNMSSKNNCNQSQKYI